jgi:hypothetical protein
MFPAAEEPVARNREGRADYDIRWPWTAPQEPGITAVLRARDEARNLPWVLPPLLDAVPSAVVIDNRSADHTLDVARRVVTAHGAADRVTLTTYPFDVSRCGPEHLATPADSVHSLAYFYNWSFAQARTRYSLKWDGDMVLTAAGVSALRDLGWQLEAQDAFVVFQHFPLYVESERVAYFDHVRNTEGWIYPQSEDYTFVKGFDWEIRKVPAATLRLVQPAGLCFELKWLDSDEFAHWSDPAAADPTRSPRKAREYAVFTALREGRLDDLKHVSRIEAPVGVHVIDYVARTWLPSQPLPFAAAT